MGDEEIKSEETKSEEIKKEEEKVITYNLQPHDSTMDVFFEFDIKREQGGNK